MPPGVSRERKENKMTEKNTAPKADTKAEKKETVIVRLPREKKDQEDKIVWVNANRYIIKRGEPVEVPIEVAKLLWHEENMMQEIYEFEAANAKG